MTQLIDEQAASLRQGLVEQLRSGGSIVSASVEAAFGAVPRHLFAAEVSLEEAYANDAVRTKRDERGVTVSSVSAPWLQAEMLEQADVHPGMRCLEIGSGGYNAALMAELVGSSGAVTTMDIDSDITDRARRCLDAAGYPNVTVVLGDAEFGVIAHAPYDRILVTVGVWDIPPAWLEQLAEGGRIVAPLRMRGLSRSVSLIRDDDHLVSTDHRMAGFVDVQGAGALHERLVLLHGDDVAFRLDEDRPISEAAMRSAVAAPSTTSWSGVEFAGSEPFDGLFLWLATVLNEYALLTRARTKGAAAIVDPASPMGTPALLGEDGFAYLTYRETGPDSYEFGAIAHGPAAAALATALTEQVQEWDARHRHGGSARISIYPAATTTEPLPAGRVVVRRHTKIVISWP